MNRQHDPLDDAALRALYRQAQGTISPSTTARLHRARHAATRSATAPGRGWRLPLAAGFAAVFALAIGVRLSLPVDAPETPALHAPMPALAASGAATPLDDELADVLAGFEESPDFYRWLAANETTLLALE